jgi:hypothetical protein
MYSSINLSIRFALATASKPAMSRIGFSKAFLSDDGSTRLFSLFCESRFHLFDLLLHLGLALAYRLGLMMRERCAVPLDPAEVVLQPVRLFAWPASGPVGVVINIPVFESPSFCMFGVHVRDLPDPIARGNEISFDIQSIHLGGVQLPVPIESGTPGSGTGDVGNRRE